MDEVEPTTKDFIIHITGSAEYDPKSATDERKKHVINFQQVANIYLKKHGDELAKIFEDLAPLEGNSFYTKSFSIREVDVEA